MLNLERATKDLSESAEDEHGELPTLDRTLVATLARRQFLVEQAAASGRSIEELVDPVRLARLLTRVQAWAMEDGLSPVLAQRVYVAILQDTIPRQLRLDTTRRQQTHRVALDCSPPVSTGPSHD